MCCEESLVSLVPYLNQTCNNLNVNIVKHTMINSKSSMSKLILFLMFTRKLLVYFKKLYKNFIEYITLAFKKPNKKYK